MYAAFCGPPDALAAFASLASLEVTPGSTIARVSPLGSAVDDPSAATTRASTPSEGPTHRDSDMPRTPFLLSAVSGSGRCESVFTDTQSVHFPVTLLRVRTWAVPLSSALCLSQVTPTSENGSVPVRGSSRLVLPSAFSSAERTLTGRGVVAEGPEPPVASGLATAYVTTPAPPRTTAPIVTQALRLRLSGLYA